MRGFIKFIKAGTGELVKADGYSKQVLLKGLDMVERLALVQFIIIEPHQHAALHFHKKTMEVFYMLEGEGFIKINGQEFHVSPGDTMVCEPGDKHEVKNNSDQVWRYIVFKTFIKGSDNYWV
jgi:quercetin dioxygenase-like cupin family protein